MPMMMTTMIDGRLAAKRSEIKSGMSVDAGAVCADHVPADGRRSGAEE